MNQRAIVEVVCKSGLNNLAGEIGALLGQDLTCSDIQLDLISKSKLFSNPQREKSALTRMSVTGDREGSCYLLTQMSTAVILGGTLIMLPQDMIEENVQSGKLDGELNDAFGEVANIIAGVFTQAFVDKYPQTLRFIKKTVEELVPTKIDPDSDEPFVPGNYFVASCKMNIADQSLGLLEFVVPAAVFGLEEAAGTPSQVAEQQQAEERHEQPTKPSAQTTVAAGATSANEQQSTSESSPAPTTAQKPVFADAKKLTDVVFKATISQVGEEIGALLGKTLTCDDVQLVMTSKADFFSTHCIEKSILTHMKVTGDKEGLGFMLVQVPDAVILGGTLIMLPEDQIEEQKNSGTFDGEVADSFGEIANILAGSLTQVFLDRYPKQIRFIKTDTETVVPTKIDPASTEPFPEGSFYLASFAIHLQDHELNRIQLIFPAEVFDLDSEASALPGQNKTAAAEGPAPGEWGGPPLEDATTEPSPTSVTDTASQPVRESSHASGSAPVQTAAGQPIVLIIGDQKNDAAPFAETLSAAGYDCRVLSFQDEIKDLFQQHQILGIFLVMAQVGEKGFAAAIKLQAAGRPLPPIIFAGPEWTKTAVLRAVKYGAKDILVMPASGDEIQDKASQHMKKAS